MTSTRILPLNLESLNFRGPPPEALLLIWSSVYILWQATQRAELTMVTRRKGAVAPTVP